MPSGRTPTDVANKSLALLGDGRTILTLDDATPRARLLRRFYVPARDEVLAAHPWNEAIARVTLPASSGVDPRSYDNAFLKPNDCLRWLPWDRHETDWFEGEEEGDYIFANTDALGLRYIRRLEAVASWSPGLESAVAAKLAFYAAKPITGQSAVRQQMAELYESELARAKQQDGLKSGTRTTHARFRSNWLQSRRGRRGWLYDE